MALDGIFLKSLVNEFKNELLNGKVEKIYQPEKDEVILNIRNAKNTYKLLISANSTYPKIHISSTNKVNPIEAPMFCMILRKYLGSSKLIDIRQFEGDRIVIMDFQSQDELGFESIYSLIVEIMGRHSNITLLRQRDQIIMDSIKHISFDVNSVRCLYPGIKYNYPPPSKKLNPLNFTKISFDDFISKNNIETNFKMLSNIFTGVSIPFSKSLMSEYNLTDNSSLFSFINNHFNKIKEDAYDYILYMDNNKVEDFYCFPLYDFKDKTQKHYSSPSTLISDFYFEKDKQNRLNSKSSHVQKLINTNIDRCTKKLYILNEVLVTSKDKDKHKIIGQLLTSNIYSITPKMDSISLLNYFNEEEEYITIKLDKNLSASENIQIYFKKYNKAKKAEEAARLQIEHSKEELLYLNSVLTSIKNAESYVDIEEIRNELIETGYIKFKKNKNNKKSKLSKPLHFLSTDGIDIYIGRNNLQNDNLTLKFAEKHHIWMHTKNIPGSHVIITEFKDIPESTLLEAGCLAAFYSKARASTKVEVDYTQVKNVKKPSGAKPGMVIYYTNKTLLCDAKSPEELKIKEIK